MAESKILIVDDEKFIFNIMEDILSIENFACLHASSAEEANKKLSEEKIDLIILDLMLPGIDGFEYLGILKSKKDTMEIPVMVVSGTGTVVTQDECLELGAIDYLPKPIRPKELILRVKNALKDDNGNKIFRSIELQVEYQQVGWSLLAYFQEIVKQKYPDIDIKMAVQQIGSKISLTIETFIGRREMIEDILEEYGMILSGSLAPEKVIENPDALSSLKHKLNIIKTELEWKLSILFAGLEQIEAQTESLEQRLNRIYRTVGEGLLRSSRE
jgi:DNA-binding response OmpR family regulator